MSLDELSKVWTPSSAVLAIIAGVVYGILAGRVANNPTYSSGVASPIHIAIVTGVFAASSGLIFFAAQTLGSYLSNDPNWSRVMSRYGQWVLFSVTIACTTWALVRRDRAVRRKRAREIITSGRLP